MNRQPNDDLPPDIPGLVFVEKVASGGYSHVYRYEQQMPRRQVAVKVLKDPGLTESMRQQFVDEANTMAQLAGHPHIVPVFAADFAPDGRPYLAMMYYPNRNMHERSADQPFSVAETIRIGIQVGSAVETAHRAGILHRDIKPANILTSPYGTPGLTDFGIAGQIVAADDEDEGGVSPPWAAPEVLLGTAPATVRSDVYSLGATLWNLLVGRSPFAVAGDNGAYALMQRVRESPVPATGRAEVPSSLERLLKQSMSKDPAVRPGTALDFCRGLQAIEHEQRLDRTEIVVLSEPAPHRATVDAAPSVADATRVRVPVVVDAQRSAPPIVRTLAPPMVRTAAPAAEELEQTHRPNTSSLAQPPPASDAQQRRLAPEPQPTVRRAVPPAAPQPEETPQPLRFSRRGSLIALAIVALAAVLIGWLLVGRKPEQPPVSKPTGNQTGAGQNAGGLADDLPPGEPAVTAKLEKAGVVRFSWTYSAAEPGHDTYLWQTPDGTQHNKATVSHVDLRLAGKSRLCVQVKVFRADGSNPPADWSPDGCYPR